MSQQAKISYTVSVADIPRECADILEKQFDHSNLESGVHRVAQALNEVDLENFDVREGLVRLEKLRSDLAVLDQRVVEVTSILVGLQNALTPQQEEAQQPEILMPDGDLVGGSAPEEG